MKKGSLKLTTAQFAKLHDVNKRTLHYYDSIHLFSPNSKGENNYRYYDILQGLDFEYIRMLKEINLSIEEIKDYVKNPNAEDFIKIADIKTKELDEQIQSLMRIKDILQKKKRLIEFCDTLHHQEIQVVSFKEEKILMTPYSFEDDDLSHLFSHVKELWGIEQMRMGIGSFISVDKIKENNFEIYDGLFSPASKKVHKSSIAIKPAGTYICGYQRGTWDELPKLYNKILEYARDHQLELEGYAYEMGLNDFVIGSEEEYITQIIIKVKEVIDSTSAV